MGLRREFPTNRLDLLDMIEQSRYGEARLCNNTTAERAHEDGVLPYHSDVIVRYHGHPIVTLHHDQSVTLNDCGWRTSTTKERLNLFAPHDVGIWQHQRVWYYRTFDNGVPQPWQGRHRFDRGGNEWEPTCETCGVWLGDPNHRDVHGHLLNA